MRQEPSDRKNPTRIGRRLVLFVLLSIGVSFIIAACVASYAQTTDLEEDGAVTTPVQATKQPTPSLTAVPPTLTPQSTPTSIPADTSTPTAIVVSPLHFPADTDRSAVYTHTQSLTETHSLIERTETLVTAVKTSKLTDLLAMTVTKPLTMSAGVPISVSNALSNGLMISETSSLTIELAPAETEQVDLSWLVPTPTPSQGVDADVDADVKDLSTSESTPDGLPRSVNVPILMYHYVSIPPADADIYRKDLSIDPADFAAHLDRMQEDGYTTISLYDLLDHLTLGASLPEKPVIITFDDGYRDNYENAFPALAERGMTATFFVVTDFIDERREAYFSWDMLREMLDTGMSIESHGRNHVTLKGQGTDYLVWQALGSMETIEFELGTRPRFISYPAGEYDQATLEIFKSADYWAGLTTVQGATHDSEDLFELRRVRVRGTTTPDELRRLLALDW